MEKQILIALIIIACAQLNSQSQNRIPGMNYKPIGIIHTEYSTETGAPRQGILVPDNSGTIEIFPQYRQALTTLDSFDQIESGKLYVNGIDAFDGTPVLDIKPYLPSRDCVNSPQNDLMEHKLGHHDEIFIKDSSFFK